MAMKIRQWKSIRPIHFLFLLTLALFLGIGPAQSQSAGAQLSLLTSDITVTPNPYGNAPLTALATFQTSLNCSVQVRVMGEVEVTKIFENDGTDHAVPILGLYPDRLNTVLLTLFTHHGTPESHLLSIKTGPLPDVLPDIEINAAGPGPMEPGMNLSTVTVRLGQLTGMYPIMFDRNGDIRWYLDLTSLHGLVPPFERINDGNFLGGIGDSIYEYDPLGRLVDQIRLPGYNFHHDIRELPNGHVVACVDRAGTMIVNSHGLIPSTGDAIIEIDRTTKSVVNSWDMRQLLDVSRNEQINSTGDWLHMNGLWYSASDNCLIVSGRHQGLFKVTWDNKLKWILAPHQGWGNAGFDGSGPPTAPYLLTAVDAEGNPYNGQVEDGFAGADDFDWNYGQHNPHILPNGNLLFFDNGDFRYFLSVFPEFSRCAEFHVDETAMTVQQVWQYGKERGAETFSRIISAVDLLPLTQNRLFCPGIVQTASGSYAKVIEVSYPDQEVIFEATLHFKNLLAPPNTAIADNVYRSFRISIYP
jgi:arylsulfate sulfotransferase